MPVGGSDEAGCFIHLEEYCTDHRVHQAACLCGALSDGSIGGMCDCEVIDFGTPGSVVDTSVKFARPRRKP